MSIMLPLDLIPLALAKLPHTLAENSIFILSECTVVSLIITDHRDHFYLPTSQQVSSMDTSRSYITIPSMLAASSFSQKDLFIILLVCLHFLYNIYILWFGVVSALTRDDHI